MPDRPEGTADHPGQIQGRSAGDPAVAPEVPGGANVEGVGHEAPGQPAPGDVHVGGHGHGEHNPFHAHHYDTMEQQFDSGKLGIWLFLASEILFFSALFVCYAIWRSNHPAIFEYVNDHGFLNKSLGFLNTVILLFSSFTMAWGVRCAQKSQTLGLVVCIYLTIACATGFMCIKYIEYSHKVHEGVLWAGDFTYGQPAEGEGTDAALPAPAPTPPSPAPLVLDEASIAGEYGTASGTIGSDEVAIAEKDEQPPYVGTFFSIYFAMTGLHGLHIIGGIAVMFWLMVRSAKGHFSAEYNGPVDYVGLYWHLVDLIWIYLFPLLYLVK